MNRLTAVIPTYNRPDMLPRAIESCLAQTVPVDIIIADDGDNPDEIAAICAPYVDFRHFRYAHTGAKTAWQNWRAGAKAADTEFIAWHQDDDVVRPTWAARIISAFDRFPDANVWLARLHNAPHGHPDLNHLGLWCSGNGPWVPMDLIGGTPSSWREGSILASTSYAISWSLAPGFAFRNGEAFHAALERMPDDCDIFVERLIPAMVANGGPFIADPIIAGYWVLHDKQLSQAQHIEQPRQTKVMVAELDKLMDAMPAMWDESLAAWCQLIPVQHVIQWINQIDVTVKEGGPSRYARKVQAILVKSLEGRVEYGYAPVRWWHKARNWVKARAAL